MKLRFSASRSITRANPTQLLPGTTFSDPSAQNASAGNPDLTPYTSNNIDIGGELYTGEEGYIGLALFRKDIHGFTQNQQTTVPFSALGIPFDALGGTQQAAINSRGGPDVATIVLTRPVNVDDLQINGLELTWVQPLSFLVEGLGYAANVTRILQETEGSVALATGIAPWTYNLTGYYENHGVSVRVTYVYQDSFVDNAPPNQGINVATYSDSRGQLDLSVSYALPFWGQ